MRTLETNDWIMLNNIIYNIYTTENLTDMRNRFLEQIGVLLDFDSADFFLASGDGKNKLCSPVFYHCKENLSESYDTLDYSRGILYSGQPLIYRETDIISDDVRVQTEYYKRVYKPNNWHYSLQMILAKNKEFVGVVTFYRTAGKDDFEYDDIFLLDLLKDHMAYRLYKSKKSGNVLDEKLTVSAAVEEYELTRREETILRLLMAGEDNAVICAELTITANTLKKHILNIYRKLGIKNRVQLFKMIKEKE